MASSNTLIGDGRGRSMSLHGRFFDGCTGYEDRIALRSVHRQWRYSELRDRIEEMSGALATAGVSKGAVVALAACRTFEAVAAIYAVLALGAVYVPIDKRLPHDRIDYMLRVSGCRWVISDDPGRYAGIPLVRTLDLERLTGRHRACLPSVGADDLAYILFTSGTTGRPKGVMVSHGSGAGLLDWALSRFSPADFACALAATPFSFDVSVFEIFAPLACGGSLFMVDSILSLADLPPSVGITLVNSVPSAMTALLEFALPLRSVRACLLAGEPVRAALTQRLYEAGVSRVYNLYGPTEDTVFSTEYLVGRDETGAVPIGTPLPGREILIVDQALSPVPTGAVGELCISGNGLANGYVNQPDLTAECFVSMPHAPRSGAVMYRTGDRVRLGADGLLYFVGRMDSQVKVRGHRIELEEIAHVIASVPGVAQACAHVHDLAADTGALSREIIVGYVMTHPECPDAAKVEAAIMNTLASRLPDYMRPRHLIFLDAFPLSPSGKLESRHLPRPTIKVA